MQTRNSLRLLLMCLLLECLAGTRGVAWGQATANWRVGDSWKVGTWQARLYQYRSGARTRHKPYDTRGRMIVAVFEVTDIQTVCDKPCYEVQMTYPREDTGFQRRYRLYYCKESGRLLRIRDVSLRPGGAAKDEVTDYPADAQGPTIMEDLPSLVPLDWPDFARQNLTSRPTGATTTSQVMTRTNPQPAKRTAQQENSFALTRTSASMHVQVTQRWRPDEHWWREAKRYENGRLVAEAVLLEVKGTRIADVPSEAR